MIFYTLSCTIKDWLFSAKRNKKIPYFNKARKKSKFTITLFLKDLSYNLVTCDLLFIQSNFVTHKYLPSINAKFSMIKRSSVATWTLKLQLHNFILFHVLGQLLFTTSEKKLYYYHQTMSALVASQVTKQLKVAFRARVTYLKE